MDFFDTRLFDMMQAHPFWLMDISPTLNPPFLVFNPFLGFSGVSGLSIEAETDTYRPINSMYPYSFITGATVGAISLSRGARLTDTDFYRWLERAINGVDKSRRNLLLIHFTTKALLAGKLNSKSEAAKILEGIRVPGRVWLLEDCIPVSYTAGDFDATSSEVVVQELSLQPRVVVEVALGAII